MTSIVPIVAVLLVLVLLVVVLLLDKIKQNSLSLLDGTTMVIWYLYSICAVLYIIQITLFVIDTVTVL